MPQHERAPSSWPWPYPRWQRWLIELVSLAVILGLLALAVTTVRDSLRAQQIASGFGFLQREAGFAIAETPIAYSPADSYARALAVGLVNTVRVSLPALFGATVLGVLLAVALRSAQPLARRGARVYVECFRNTPLLLQLFLWYALLTTLLPPPRQAWQPLAAVFVSNRGLYLPVPLEPGPWLWALAVALPALVAALRLRGRLLHTRRRGRLLAPLALFALPVLATLWLGDASAGLSQPVLRGFNFVGGTVLTPEFAALGLGLTLYSASYIAEIVRGGIDAVPAGQREAALAVGLTPVQALRLVLLPQAVRVALPPYAGQALSLIKNSSLAVAIGYPDLLSIASTTINQTGQAIEGIAIVMAAYLSVNLAVAGLIALWGRGR